MKFKKNFSVLLQQLALSVLLILLFLFHQYLFKKFRFQTYSSYSDLLLKDRRVTRRAQTSVDECKRVTDVSRRMQASVDESNFFSLIPEKVTHDLILLLLQLCNSRPYRYAHFQFYSFICDYCSSKCFYSLMMISGLSTRL